MPHLHQLTIDGRACLLVLPERDWATRPKITHHFDTVESESLSGVEAAAPRSLAMRLSLDYYYSLDPEIAEEWVADFLALGIRRLALPLALDDLAVAEYTSDLRIYSPAHDVNYDPATGAYAIDGPLGYPRRAGLVICALVDRPKIVARTDLHATVQLRAEEDSPWASRVAVNTLAAPTWVWEPDWVSPPEDLSKWQLRRQQLGRGREQAVSGEEAPAKRGQKAQITLGSRDEMRALLTFWVSKLGAHGSFTAPLWFRPGWDGVSSPPEMQAHFGQDALQLECLTQDHARTTVTLWQRLLLTGGEPEQQLPPRAMLLRLWWSGSSTNFLWTDWESPLVHDSLTYEPKQLEVRPPTETLRVGDSEWEFQLDDFAGNPLRAFTLLALERRLHIEIRECDPQNPSAAALRFVGEVQRAPSKGKVYTAACVLLGGRLRRLVPGFYDQPDCNYTFYSELCGVSRAAKEKSGTVSVVNGLVVDITTAAAEAADWFAAGDAEFGAGDSLERRYVVRSAPIAGGQRLTLQRPLRALGVGTAVKFWPGCDGQFAGGCLRHGNQPRFGGFPHKPAYIEAVNTGYKANAAGK